MFFAAREGFRVLFERADKSKEWHTALYYFAEHVRSLSFGRINYKALYARLDSSRVPVNHENSAVRKRSAPILSRTIHSQRYIDALRASYNANPLVFKEVAAWLFEELKIDATILEPQMAQYVQECLWPDVCTGLANEISGGRTGIGFGRVRREMNAFIASVSASCASYSEKFVSVISAILELMTFGKLDSSAMHTLCEQTRPLPKITSDGDVGAVTCDQTLTGEQNATGEQSSTCEQIATCAQASTSVKPSACAQTPALAQTRVALEPDVACLVRVCGLRYELPRILQYGVAFDLFSDVPKDSDPHSETPCSILDAWMVAGGGVPFLLGRYTDCDLVDSALYVSRRHCFITQRNGKWFVRDEGSTYGTVVQEVTGEVVFDSTQHEHCSECEIHFGQWIVLAGCSRYWFCGLVKGAFGFSLAREH